MERVVGWRMASIAMLMAAMMASVAQAQQPTIVLSIRGIDELLEDVDYVGEELNQAGLKDTAENQIQGLTQGKGLAGIDQSKPLGAYWSVSGGGPETTVIFLPVKDADELKGLLKDLTPDFKESKGQWTFNVAGTDVIAKLSGGYLFASASAESLAKLPDLKKIVNPNYDLAVDLSVASIPDQIKEFFLAQTEAGGRRSMEDGPEPANKAEELGREYGFEGFLAVLKSLTNDGDRLTLGIDVNSEKKVASADVAVTSKANTDLAKSLATFGKTTPMFSSVGSDAAPLRMVVSYPTTGITEQLEKLFDAIRDSALEEIKTSDKLDSDDDKKVASGFVTRIIDVVKATVKTGSMHSGLALESGDGGKARFLMGSKVAKGDDASKVMDDVLGMLKESPDIAEVKIDAAKHAGARIHAVNPKHDDDLEKHFGDGPFHLAVRNDSFWMAAGVDNLAALKKAFDQFGKTSTRSAAPISLQVKPAALVVLMEKDNEDLIAKAKELAGKPGDKFNVEIVPVANGAKLRLEFGIELLQLATPDDDEN